MQRSHSKRSWNRLWRGAQAPSLLIPTLLVTSHLSSHLAPALLAQVTPWEMRAVEVAVAEAKVLLKFGGSGAHSHPRLARRCSQANQTSYPQTPAALPRHCPEWPSSQARLQGHFFPKVLPDALSDVASPSASPLVSLDF